MPKKLDEIGPCFLDKPMVFLKVLPGYCRYKFAARSWKHLRKLGKAGCRDATPGGRESQATPSFAQLLLGGKVDPKQK